jgi:uncharacterized protein with PQ loop repeat
MTSILGFGLTALLISVFIWVLPIILILRSKKTNGVEKLLWILAVIFVSWFAWILYLLLAPWGREGREQSADDPFNRR